MKNFVITFVLALAAILTSGSAVWATETDCTGPLNGYYDSIVVPSGASCTLNQVTIKGNVTVSQNASLTVIGLSAPIAATIGGNVSANQCVSVVINGSKGAVAIGGNVEIGNCTQASGFVGPGVTIGGNFHCHDNAAPCQADAGAVVGNVNVSNNSAATASDISQNVIGGNLNCQSNTPAPTATGGTDTVTGTSRGQCATGFASATPPANCSLALNFLNVPGVSIVYAQDVAAAGATPEFCQVVGTVVTNGDGAGQSSAGFLLRLPHTWNNRFVFMGCGGACGSFGSRNATTGIVSASLSVNTVDSGEALGLGYAVVNTDTGHEPISGSNLPNWSLLAPGVPNKPALADFYYRSVHDVTGAAKQLVQKYYNGNINYAYFDGCSTGGRQAAVSADQYPDDFDGVIAGDPIIALDTIRGMNFKAVKSWLPSGAFLSNTTIAAFDSSVIANCDALDGVSDGLIQNPQACTLDPNTLVGTVLTQPQATGITLYLNQLIDTKGRWIHPGFGVGHWATAGFGGIQNFNNAPAPHPTSPQPWSSTGAQITTGSIPGPVIWTLGDPAIRYYTERDPSFDSINQWPEGANIGQPENVISSDAVKLAAKTTGAGAADDPAKLLSFLSKNHKMILYHGFSDNLASPNRTIWFYRELAEQAKGYGPLQQNVRLFMVPGMGHCSGGTSPNSFDTLKALAAWVENGTAPDALAATNTGNGNAMPLCKFPEEATYLGGPTTAASSWKCDPNDQRLLNAPGFDGYLAGMGHNSTPSVK